MGSRNGNSSGGILREVRAIRGQAQHVWRLVPRRHKLALGLAGLVMAVTSACSTALPLFLGRLVDDVKSGTDLGHSADELYRTAAAWLGLIATAYLLREGLNVVRRYLVENSCTRLEKVLTVRVVGHLLKVDLATLTQEKLGALQGRISRSVLGFVRFLRLGFLDFLPPLAGGLFALAAALCKQPWLALAMAGIVPLSLFLTVRQLVSQKGIRLKLMRNREEMDATVVEQLSGIDYVRAANTHQREVERVAAAAERRRAREVRHHFQMSLFGCAKALNEGFFHILVIALAIVLAVRGAISFGDILTFSILFLNVMAPLNEVHRVVDEGHECSLQVADLLDMLAEPTDRSFSPRAGQEPRLLPKAPALAVEGLAVEYETVDGARRRALDGVSLEVCHGETVGIAGRSGCGKTTLLRVLLWLTHPASGQVLVGGVSLEEVSREAIGRLVGYVGQSPFLFAGTVAENIAYGCDGVTTEDIERAARMACIHDEVVAMPSAYDAPVLERGQNLSGGQRQRLALARVFLKDPPLLVLDEGTSALDTISERSIQRALVAARADRTVILVAHRLSTLAEADRIFVFDGGRIAETGSYPELVTGGGVFTELAHAAA